MSGVLPSVLVLAVIAMVAPWLRISRGGDASEAAVRQAGWVAMIAIVGQASHFAEELTTGLPRAPSSRLRPPADIAAPFRLVQPGVAGDLGGERVDWRAGALFPLWFLGVQASPTGSFSPSWHSRPRATSPASSSHYSWPPSARCTVSRADLVAAAREAGDADFDVQIACAFNFDAHSADFDKLGRVPILKARMNADLHMASDLKNTGKGNLFVIFVEPDIDLFPAECEDAKERLTPA